MTSVTLLGVALLFVWLTGTHLHLCLDGQEPPMSLHRVADGGVHPDHHGPEEEHTDLDVEITSLARSLKSSFDLPPLLPAVEQPSAAPARVTYLRQAHDRVPVRLVEQRLLHPRAPPV